MQKSVEIADRLGCRLEGAYVRVEMGRRLADEALLQQGETELVAMRSGR